MKTVIAAVATISMFEVIEYFFGENIAFWVALSIFTLCIGVFWGAGDQILKQKGKNQ